MKATFTSIFLLILFILINVSCFAQMKKYETKVGYGFYQGFNAGINYFYKENLNVGIGIGTHFNLPPLESENHFNISIENKMLFGQPIKQKMKPWFFNQQLMYWEQGSPNDRWKILSFGINIGGTMEIVDNLALTLEIGPAFNWVVDVERDKRVEQVGWMWPVLYNGRIQLVHVF